jgi:TetR/AcrR family transcriptional regulator, cholesterol catabolism regulator
MNTELDKILEAAERIFKKYGVRSVSMDDIARELGISKKTLYVYVENKEDLIKKSLTLHIVREQAQIEIFLNTAPNSLDAFVKIGMHVQQEIQNLNPVLMYDLQKYHRDIWLLMEGFQKEIVYTFILSNIKKGIAEGLYRSNLNAEILAKCYLSAMPLFGDTDLFRLYAPAEIHKQFITYHIHGLVTDKGRALLETYPFFKD